MASVARVGDLNIFDEVSDFVFIGRSVEAIVRTFAGLFAGYFVGSAVKSFAGRSGESIIGSVVRLFAGLMGRCLVQAFTAYFAASFAGFGALVLIVLGLVADQRISIAVQLLILAAFATIVDEDVSADVVRCPVGS